MGKFRAVACALLSLVALVGCGGEAINRDTRTTFLTAGEVGPMTDTMAAKIASDPKIAALTQRAPMVIVLWPVQNDTNQIMPPSQKWLYVHRVRVLLSKQGALRDRFRFVLNRRDYQALQREEGLSPEQLGVPEERLKPTYCLTGTFSTLTNVSAKKRDDYYLCTFRLCRIKPDGTAGEIIWEDAYETRKMTKKDLLD